MNWIRIDHTAFATEIPGAGCFVRFFGNPNPVFAPGVTIRTTKIKHKEVNSLVAAPFNGTHISFTTDTMTTQAGSGWVGDAGERLDKKLAALNKKKGIKEPEVGIELTTFDTPYRGVAKISRSKLKKVKFGTKK